MPVPALNPNDPRFRSFQSNIFQVGIDLRRSIITSDPGAYVADPGASFLAGQVLALNAAQNLVVCDGLGSAPINVPFGFAKWNKALAYQAAQVDEAIVAVSSTAVNLQFANLFNVSGAAGVSVRSAPGQAGTVYAETTDYTVNYTNGQITAVASGSGGSIPNGATVYVTYQYQVTSQMLDFQGRNFYNFTDDVTIQQGRIAVIQNFSILFTTAYDPSRTYTMSQQLTVDTGVKAGFLTNQAGGRPSFGKVFQLPSSDDPFLGIVTPGHA